MQIIDSLTYALRNIIGGRGGAVTRGQYQCAGEVAPENEPLYIREAVIPTASVAQGQRGMRYDFVAQYDIFCRRDAFPDPVREMHDVADRIMSRFSPIAQPFGCSVELIGWTGAQCFVSAPAEMQAVGDSDNFLQLPILLYFTVIADETAFTADK